jgi:hypothetical protein
MDAGYYTHALWRVRSGRESEFIELWENDLARAFRAANPEASGTLIQSLEDPTLFYSFGPWPTLSAMAAARQAPGVGAALEALKSVCVEATPGTYKVVLRIPSES